MKDKHLITPEEYSKLVFDLESLVFVENMDELILNLAGALKTHAANSDPDQWSMENLANETFYEKLVMKVLMTIRNIREAHMGKISLPCYPTCTETLSAQEKLELEARRTRERAMKLKGEDLKVLKDSLEEMYNFACIDTKTTKDAKEDFKRTWEALDAELEADMKMTESIKAI